jgi:hypothetical protein
LVDPSSQLDADAAAAAALNCSASVMLIRKNLKGLQQSNARNRFYLRGITCLNKFLDTR